MIDKRNASTVEKTGHCLLAVLDNLFFSAKINQAAERAGVKANHAKNIEQALGIAHTERPSLIIVDLEAVKYSPVELIKKLKSDEDLRSIQILGFVSHLNTGLQQQAREAGIDRVLARSVFDRDLVTLLNQLSQ
jgi:two-component system, cell cycle response regulator DivK